jgi:hypothetical protein
MEGNIVATRVKCCPSNLMNVLCDAVCMLPALVRQIGHRVRWRQCVWPTQITTVMERIIFVTLTALSATTWTYLKQRFAQPKKKKKEKKGGVFQITAMERTQRYYTRSRQPEHYYDIRGQ